VRPEYDSAIETLAYAVNPVQSRDANKRKALTVKDLLIKVRLTNQAWIAPTLLLVLT